MIMPGEIKYMGILMVTEWDTYSGWEKTGGKINNLTFRLILREINSGIVGRK